MGALVGKTRTLQDGGHEAAVSVSAPLLVTAVFALEAQERFQRWRDVYFPRERSFVPAHLSLFHKLPGDERAQIASDLREVTCGGEWQASATEVRSIGSGFAIVIECLPLTEARAALASRWRRWLTPQDNQKFWPHVVIQNKVPAEQVRSDAARFLAGFQPFTTRITALALWNYLGGPWRLEREFPLRNLT